MLNFRAAQINGRLERYLGIRLPLSLQWYSNKDCLTRVRSRNLFPVNLVGVYTRDTNVRCPKGLDPLGCQSDEQHDLHAPFGQRATLRGSPSES